MLRSHLLRQVSPGGIEFIGATGGNSSTDNDFINMSYGPFSMPSGVAAGDMYVLMQAGNRGHAQYAPTIGGNSPDTAVYAPGSSPTSNNPCLTLFYGTLTSAEVTNGGVVLQKTGGTPQDPIIAVAFFRGVSTFPTQSTTYSTNMIPPNVPVNCNLAVVAFDDENNSAGGYTAPSGFTEAIEQASTNSTNAGAIFYKIDTISSGTNIGSIGGTDDKSCAVTLGFTI